MNAELKADGTIELTLKRVLPFPRQRIFDAWIQPKHLMRWMGPTPDINLDFAEVDARPGGSYRMGFKDPDCQTSEPLSIVHGEFLMLEPPSTLKFTWIWEQPVPDAGAVTVVTVELSDVSAGTELTLTHQRLPNQEFAQRHEQGWIGTLDKFQRYLERPHSTPISDNPTEA